MPARRYEAALLSGAVWVVMRLNTVPGRGKLLSRTPSDQIRSVFHRSSPRSVRLPGTRCLVWTSSIGCPPLSKATSSNFSTDMRTLGETRLRRRRSSRAWRHWYKYPCMDSDAENLFFPIAQALCCLTHNHTNVLEWRR